MVIVKSKITGKFLRQHSGSFNDFKSRIRWQVLKDKTLELPPKSMRDLNRGKYSDWYSNDPNDERQKAIKAEIYKRMYSAEALEARRYATPGSATSSVGKWRSGPPTKHLTKGRVYYLPDNLEIHEIVAGNLCLVNPNDDEETKLRKKEKCNE